MQAGVPMWRPVPSDALPRRRAPHDAGRRTAGETIVEIPSYRAMAVPARWRPGGHRTGRCDEPSRGRGEGRAGRPVDHDAGRTPGDTGEIRQELSGPAAPGGGATALRRRADSDQDGPGRRRTAELGRERVV